MTPPLASRRTRAHDIYNDLRETSRAAHESATRVSARLGASYRVERPKDTPIDPERRESRVPKVIITHAVEDVERWLAGKADRAAAVESMSGSNVADHVAEDGSNQIAISADIADLDKLKAALAAPPPEILEKMQKHGVVPPFTVYVEA
jgi:hypothetical protein